MNILLIAIDSKFPNLALMQLSSFHKSLGDRVSTQADSIPDQVYISCIFSKNADQARGVAEYWRNQGSHVQLGGSGIDYRELPYGVQHMMPDYSLYHCKYSLGFTSRGCNRRCPWCIVPDKEGPIRDNAPVSEFLRPDMDRVMLFDNNFLASPRWKENLEFITENKLKVCFTQGLDIRLVERETAQLLKNIRSQNTHFTHRYYYFAFDLPEIEDSVVEGVRLLNEAGIPSSEICFYILVGFNTSHQEDLQRVKTIQSLHADCFVMPYNNIKKTKDTRRLIHYANRKQLYGSVHWESLRH